jgi:hypothetical protein
MRCHNLLVPLVFVVLPTLAAAQRQFLGKWQNKKASITISIAVSACQVSGEVILADVQGDLEMPISNPRQNGNVLEFESKDRDATFYWRLAVIGKKKARLEGCMREMLFDERVRKRQ